MPFTQGSQLNPATSLNPAATAIPNVATQPIVGAGAGQSSASFAATDPRRIDAVKGAARPAQDLTESQTTPEQTTVTRSNGNKIDTRVKILVPPSYQTSFTSGYRNNLKPLTGIIFPYTPQISFEHKADYNSDMPLHSNFSINFYKSSYVGDISINGIFTVQNDSDAITYLSTIHLLRALTKGRFGGSDNLAGSPPPICRLQAYGTFMLDFVPIAVTNFRVDLPADVDYYYINDSVFKQASVPTKSTLVLSCKPMYSRQEMLDATVPSWLNRGASQRTMGIL